MDNPMHCVHFARTPFVRSNDAFTGSQSVYEHAQSNNICRQFPSAEIVWWSQLSSWM